MILATNINQQNPSFQARFRLKKKKAIRTPLLFSSLSTFSTGTVSGYGFGHYGNDMFRPSFYKEKLFNTTQKVDNAWSKTKNKMSDIEKK